jgi:hypothetical protein
VTLRGVVMEIVGLHRDGLFWRFFWPQNSRR